LQDTSLNRLLAILRGGKAAFVIDPVLAGVLDNRRVCLAEFETVQPQPASCDFAEQLKAQILDGCGELEDFQPQRLTSSLHVIEQRSVERVVPMDQHPMVVFVAEQWFHDSVKVGEQDSQVPGSLDLEKARQPVAMPVEIAALVGQLFVSMSGVKPVLLLNDHGILIAKVAWQSRSRDTRQRLIFSD
jgi:hypothetical protein